MHSGPSLSARDGPGARSLAGKSFSALLFFVHLRSTMGRDPEGTAGATSLEYGEQAPANESWRLGALLRAVPTYCRRRSVYPTIAEKNYSFLLLPSYTGDIY
jgi:hypothetical protein